jgi:hypothetical protein
VYWYQKAADQGHAKAQYNLGVMYANGKGVLKDAKQDQYTACLASFNVPLLLAYTAPRLFCASAFPCLAKGCHSFNAVA